MKKLTLLFAFAVVLAAVPACTDPPDTPVVEVVTPVADTTVGVKADSVVSCDTDTIKKQ